MLHDLVPLRRYWPLKGVMVGGAGFPPRFQLSNAALVLLEPILGEK